MAHCSRCNKFMLFASQSGYCARCELAIKQENEVRCRAQKQRKRQEEEAHRKAEEQRKRQEEEARRKAEEEKTDRKYRSALTQFSRSISVDQVVEAKEAFASLNGYQDSAEWIQKCDDRINQLKEEAELRRKEEEEQKRKAEEEERLARELVNSKYSAGDVVYWGHYKYREHIKWHILDIDGIKGLLLSDEILDNRQFYDGSDWKSQTIMWAMSSVRKWMNETMIDLLFSKSEQKSILQSTIENGDCYGKRFATTSDRLFLLSKDELDKYKCKNILPDYTKGWWLRTKGEDLCGSSTGTLYIGKIWDSEPKWINTLGPTWSPGVRPALWVNLATANLVSEKQMEDIRKEEEERKRKEEEERRIKEEKKQEAERKRQEKEAQRKAEEEKKRKEEEERKRLEEENRIRKEKEEIRKRLAAALLRKEEEKQYKEREGQLYKEEEKQFLQESNIWEEEQKNTYQIVKDNIQSIDADMQPYSFAGDKLVSKKALVYAFNEKWEDAKKHMNRGLILEHFKRDFDADIISGLMDVDEDTSTDDQDIKMFRYLYAIDVKLDALLWKGIYFKDISDFGIQYLSALKYNKKSIIEIVDEIIRKEVLTYYLSATKANDQELLSEIEAYRKYIEALSKGKTNDSIIRRSLFAYSLVGCKSDAFSILYSILVHEKRKTAGLSLIPQKEQLIRLVEAFSILDSYKEAANICKECQSKLNEIECILDKYKVGSVISFGQFWQGEDIDEGKTDIEWIVLELKESKALLISKYVIFSNPYAASDMGNDGAEWAKSAVRLWLNGKFMSFAFSMEEQELILLSEIDNSEKQHNYSMKSRSSINRGGEDTKDKVFVLSYAEAWHYFPTEETRKCQETVFAYNESKKYGFGPSQRGLIWWWLRSPGYLNNGAPIVDEKGLYDLDNVNDISGGVRPVLWLNLDPDYEWLKKCMRSV